MQPPRLVPPPRDAARDTATKVALSGPLAPVHPGLFPGSEADMGRGFFTSSAGAGA